MIPIKVLFFINSLTSGGAERITALLSSYLAQKQYMVTIVTIHGNEKDFYSINSRVNRIYLELDSKNSGFKKIFATVERILALRNTIKKEQADIVVGMMTTPGILSILACTGFKTKVVVSERNYCGGKSIAIQWELFRKLLYRFADAHVVQTKKTGHWIKNHTNSKNINVIANPVVWPLTDEKPQLNPTDFFPKGINIILSVGSLNKYYQKGFDILINSFTRLASKYPGWYLAIVGEMNLKDGKDTYWQSLLKEIGNRNLSDRIIFPGRAGNIGDWYSIADIFVLSSRYEGFPNVLLEAMAYGCPSISFDCDTGPKEIITNSVNGFLVPPKDTETLTRTIQHLIENNELRKSIGREAKMVRERFSQNIILKDWERVFQDLSRY